MSELTQSTEVVSYISKLFLPQQESKILLQRIISDLQKFGSSSEDFKLRAELYDICYNIQQNLAVDEIAYYLFTEIVLYASQIIQHQVCEQMIVPILEKYFNFYQQNCSYNIVSFFPVILEKFIIISSQLPDWNINFIQVVHKVQQQINENHKLDIKIDQQAYDMALNIYYRLVNKLHQSSFIWLYKTALDLTIIDDILYQTILEKFRISNLVTQFELLKRMPEDFINQKRTKNLQKLLYEILTSKNSIELVISFIQRCFIVDTKNQLQELLVNAIQMSLNSYQLPKRQTRLYNAVLAFSSYIDFSLSYQQFFEEISSQRGSDWNLLYNHYFDLLPENHLDSLLFYIKLFPIFGYQKQDKICSQICKLTSSNETNLLGNLEICWGDVKSQIITNYNKSKQQNWWEILLDNFK
eukprot:EST45961.1 Hypothetical protein SS50377_13940 [Spironucleus salmonicida]